MGGSKCRLQIALSDYVGKDLVLEYFIKDNADETQSDDGIYLSDDGQTFHKAVSFEPSGWRDGYGKLPPLRQQHVGFCILD
ncbi:MAG: hypothetical protein AAGI23_22560 [Bacteroidota bacterium]